jgi:hypothetical protein
MPNVPSVLADMVYVRNNFLAADRFPKKDRASVAFLRDTDGSVYQIGWMFWNDNKDTKKGMYFQNRCGDKFPLTDYKEGRYAITFYITANNMTFRGLVIGRATSMRVVTV